MIDSADILIRARKLLSRFARASGGNVAMTFALATLPVIGGVGAAVDYSRANSAKAALQASVDAAALMLSREVNTLTANQLNEKALNYVLANLNRTDLKDLKVTPIYSGNSAGELRLKAEAKLSAVVAGVIGITQMDTGADTTIKWGNNKLRVSLVLDTTGSMNDAGKMPALKTAAKNLLTQLQSAATENGDVYVSIVPFSKNVNAGASNYNASWLDWSEWEAEPEILDRDKNRDKKDPKPSNWYTTKAGSNCPFGTSNSSYGFRCVTAPQGTSTTNTVPSSGNYSGLICPGQDGGNKKSNKIGVIYNGCYNSWTECKGSECACTDLTVCSCNGIGSNRVCKTKSGNYEHTWRAAQVAGVTEYTPAVKMNGSVSYAAPPRSTWTGCVTDRGTWEGPSNDYDRKVTAPSSSIATSLFPAQQDAYCSPAVMALSYNWNSMKSMIDGLYPNGATNQPIGLVWGWQSLVGGGPFPTPPAKDPQFKYKEAIVLMSDGLNTLDRWYGNGSSTSTAVDKRMYESATIGTCANVKAAGILVYTVQVNTDKDPTSTLLKNCATSPDKFWMVTSAAALNDVFKAIGTELSQLRIAK